MSRQTKPPSVPVTLDTTLCHYCNANKLDPNEKYFLPNGIQVCKECALRGAHRKQILAKALSKRAEKPREPRGKSR